jgi:large subunit ribosomal protein L23
MRDAYDVIKAPLVTEKLGRLSERANIVAFKVHPEANKIEIQRAVQQIWSVDVVSVRTMNVPGKLKRLGRFVGRRSSWKKAIVTLAEGQSIPEMTV